MQSGLIPATHDRQFGRRPAKPYKDMTPSACPRCVQPARVPFPPDAAANTSPHFYRPLSTCLPAGPELNPISFPKKPLQTARFAIMPTGLAGGRPSKNRRRVREGRSLFTLSSSSAACTAGTGRFLRRKILFTGNKNASLQFPRPEIRRISAETEGRTAETATTQIENLSHGTRQRRYFPVHRVVKKVAKQLF